MSARFQPSEGDWICGDPKCGNVNFSRRAECNKCGRAALLLSPFYGGCSGKIHSTENKDGTVYKKGGMEIGKQLAEKSKGLFSADDWQCKGCGNVNWARRMSCNMCNTPKYGKNEARTGLGGGYNERGDVTYKDKEESDDEEFDEFGRKKKKYRAKVDDVVESPVTSQEEEGKGDVSKHNLQNDDDDDDDDEDGDLSKYALDADDDDDDDVDVSKYDLSDDDDIPSKPNNLPKDTRTDRRSRSSSSSSGSSSSSSSGSPSPHHDRSKRDKDRSRSISPDPKKSRSSLSLSSRH